MAPNSENEPPNPSQKTLHVWSKPVEQQDKAQSLPGQEQQDGSGTPNARPTISDAVSMIKTEDFATVATTPCARQGFLTGIASGAGLGGLKFVLQGATVRNTVKCSDANLEGSQETPLKPPTGQSVYLSWEAWLPTNTASTNGARSGYR